MLHTDPSHPQSCMLAAELGIHRYAATGILTMLDAMDRARGEEPELGYFTIHAVAAYIGWTGQPEILGSALASVGAIVGGPYEGDIQVDRCLAKEG